MEYLRKPKKSPPPLFHSISDDKISSHLIPKNTQSLSIQENEDKEDTADDDAEEEIPTITTQQEFIKAVKNWVTLDNQLRIFNERVKEAREARSFLTQQIHQYTEDHNFTSPSIEISDGELIICDKREYSSLSFSYIDKCLSKLIKEPAHVDRILHFLKENRESYVVPDIRRIYRSTKNS